MARMKRGITIASTLTLVSILLSACNQPYSQAPETTNTPFPQNSVFGTLVPTSELGPVEAFATGSAIAQLTTSPGAPAVSTATSAPGVTPPVAATATNTPLVSVNPTSTATLAAPSGPSATPIPAGSRPGSYTLQQGEFPFCIARRFNVNPDELLSVNGLASGDLYYVGQVLTIPQTGNPWPGIRSLNTHPTTHTVSADQDTVFAVACYYGDVDPAAIAQANGISVSAVLTVGQQLKIP